MLLEIDQTEQRKVIEAFGKKFLGKDAVLEDFEPLKAGVSYNYKVKFSGKEYVVKVDNPDANNALQSLGKGTPSQDERARDFNLKAGIINFKIANHNLRAPAFIAAQGREGEFCIRPEDALDKDSLPAEFAGKIVSMQNLVQLSKDKAASAQQDQEFLTNLATQIGRLHRPSALVSEFAPPERSSAQLAFEKNRRNAQEFYGATAPERREKIAASALEIEAFLRDIKESKPEIYSKLLKIFPEGKCDVELMVKIVEDVCAKDRPQPPLPRMQLSHNDLHTGNMIRDGSDVALIDFDDIGISEAVSDLNIQFFGPLNLIRYGDLEMSDELHFDTSKVRDFMKGYISYNPYLSKEELKMATEFVVKFACRDLLTIAQTAHNYAQDKESVSQEDYGKLDFWDKTFKIAEQQIDNKEALKQELSDVYDAAHKAAQSQTVEALLDLPLKQKESFVERFAPKEKTPESFVQKVMGNRGGVNEL